MRKRILKTVNNVIPKVDFRRFSEAIHVKKTIGQAPGTLVYTGKKAETKVHLEIFSFDEKTIIEKSGANLAAVKEAENLERINWLNIDGLHNIELINEIGEYYDLNPLMLEDILHVDQRPKMEDYDDYIFFTIKMFHENKDGSTSYEHVSFVLGQYTVISFQEKPEDIFDLLRDRLRNSYGKIRQKKADYLFYRFIDTIIDYYFLVLDRIAEKIESLEDEVMENPSTKTLQKLQVVRKELIYLRRSIYPLRESVNSVLKSDSKLIREDTERFFMDVYDHTIQIIESLETYRDLLSGIMDLYMNTASNKMNEIMKVLTIMSSIFIPITFIAGMYGMNFDHIPELHLEHGYAMVWGLILLVAGGMLLFFKKKNWL